MKGQFLLSLNVNFQAIAKGTSVQWVIANPVTVIASDCFKVLSVRIVVQYLHNAEQCGAKSTTI